MNDESCISREQKFMEPLVSPRENQIETMSGGFMVFPAAHGFSDTGIVCFNV